MVAASGDGLRRRAGSWPVVIGSVLFVAALTTGMLAGSIPVRLDDVVHMVRVKTGLTDDAFTLTDSVLWAIRLPRVLAGAVAGAALAVAGVGLQGVFRNRMADAQLVGLAPAAGLGAVAAILLGGVSSGSPVMMLGAAVGSTLLGYLIRRLSVHTLGPGELILIGIALGLALTAVLGTVVLAGDSPRLPSFTFWVFGGLAGATWSALGAGLPLVVAGTAVIVLLGRSLDLMALGDTGARHLGVDVPRVRAAALAGIGLVVGGAVGLAGVIGFVGLVVPLVLRSWVGPAHRRLTLLAGLFGAAALVAVDTAARTVAAPVEIPVGLLTATVGAPILVWFLLRRAR